VAAQQRDALGPVSASMRRTLAADDVSAVSLNTPISAVERTWVPPHSSRDHEPSPICTTRTTSPYFSPNSAMAPRRRASSSGIDSARTGWLSAISALTRSSTYRMSSSLSAAPWVKSKRSLSGPTYEPGLAHVRAQALAQRGVQQVRGRVVALGGVADRRRDARDDPRALAQRPVSTSSTTAWSSPRRSTSATRARQSPSSHSTTPESAICPPPVA
jgi:hypothetical protein